MDKPRLIIIADGEDNSYVSGAGVFEKIKEVIEKYKPVFVLSEKMENQSMETEHAFVQIMKKKRLSNMTSMDEVKELMKLCHKNKMKLIGIDFENFLMTRNQQIQVLKHRPVSEEEEKEFEDLAKRRENKHVKMIRKYLKLTRKPVVVIVGAWHLRRGSWIRNSFKDFSDGILYIYPVDERGNQAIGPGKGKLRWKESNK